MKNKIEQNIVITLCQEDALVFVSAFERPMQTNHRFLKAARKYKETITNKNY